MEAKHTFGSWRYTDGGIIDNSPTKGHAGIEIADVFGADAHDTRGPSLNEAKANATLIAAAPELLEAHEACIENMTRALELGDKGDWENAEIFINNQRGISEVAIAKATE